jgi:hypothetical protein
VRHARSGRRASEHGAGAAPLTHAHTQVSLGDIGAYGSAGTTDNFVFTEEWLAGFGYKYDIITGNHDLEGVDEFDSVRALRFRGEGDRGWHKC